MKDMYAIQAKGKNESDEEYKYNQMFRVKSDDPDALQSFVDELSGIMINTSFRVINLNTNQVYMRAGE